MKYIPLEKIRRGKVYLILDDYGYAPADDVVNGGDIVRYDSDDELDLILRTLDLKKYAYYPREEYGNKWGLRYVV